jgi:hypothetical protein
MSLIKRMMNAQDAAAQTHDDVDDPGC